MLRVMNFANSLKLKALFACLSVASIANAALPVLRIQTADGQRPGDKAAPATLQVEEGGESAQTFPISIKIRGNFSRNLPKKQFAVKILDGKGEERDAPLLGLPKASEWSFNGNFHDRSLMRNSLAYELGRETGRYAPRTRDFELYLNGDYRGVYTLTEKIERHKRRLDLPKWEKGGFIVKIDTTDRDDEWFPLEHESINVLHVYPKPSKIVKEAGGKEAIDAIRVQILNFEAIMRSKDFANAEQGYPALIDVDSFVDFMLVQELFNNIDAYCRSVHFHGRGDGKLVAGPLWDFDVGAGNFTLRDATKTEGWRTGYRNRINFGTMFSPPVTWFARLRQDPAFEARFIARWRELRPTVFSDANIDALIDRKVVELGEATDRNFARWPIFGVPDRLLRFLAYPPPWPKDYNEEIAKMRAWFRERAAWMDGAIDSF